MHLDGIAKDPGTYEPYEPDLVSSARSKIIGKKTGRSALMDKMSDLGVPVTENILGVLLAQVRTQSRLMGRPLCDTEIRQMATFAGG